ncbi:MAG: hypothetical protein E5V95_35350, partial [Mesorhizobium sp.]|uniref:hypothetical protein n=1 Tax=Mesorhizobium sp. TaxID=1871066 RepID=UPI0012019041
MSEHATARGGCLDVITVQRVPKALSGNIAPKLAHMLRLDIVKLFRREDAGTIEALCHVAADTWNILHCDGEQRSRKVFRPPDRQPVTISAAIALASLAGNFRELPVGANPIVQVIHGPTFSAIVALIFAARASGSD